MLEIDVAVAKVGRHTAAESGDTLEMIERPGGGFSFVLVDGQGSGQAAKAISSLLSARAVGLIKDGVRDGAVARAIHDQLFAYRHGQVSATLTLLTFIAARTTRLRLGTAILVLPWHNPVLLAEQVATLDLLSRGRLDLGVGKGYRHNEFAGFAMPPNEAEPRFEEVLDVLVRALASDEPFSHHGRFFCFDKVVVEPPPQRACAHPPSTLTVEQ